MTTPSGFAEERSILRVKNLDRACAEKSLRRKMLSADEAGKVRRAAKGSKVVRRALRDNYAIALRFSISRFPDLSRRNCVRAAEHPESRWLRQPFARLMIRFVGLSQRRWINGACQRAFASTRISRMRVNYLHYEEYLETLLRKCPARRRRRNPRPRARRRGRGNYFMVIIVPVYYTHNSAFVARNDANDVNDVNVQAPWCTDENYVMRVKRTRINRAFSLLSLSRSCFSSKNTSSCSVD
jgi:hypothetical protein